MGQLFRLLLAILPSLMTFSLLALRQFSSSLAVSAARYDGYKLYRLHLSLHSSNDANLVRWLESLEAEANERQQQQLNFVREQSSSPLLDIWTLPGPAHRHADILVAPCLDHTFRGALTELDDARGAVVGVELLRENIQADIDRERAAIARRGRHWRRSLRQQRRRRSSPLARPSAIDLYTYNSYPKIEHFLRRTAAENPNIAELVNLSKTFEGRDLLGIRIGRKHDGGEQQQQQRPSVIYIDGGVHAREWIAPAAALYLIDKLISLWNKHLLQTTGENEGDVSSSESSPEADNPSGAASGDAPTKLLEYFHFVVVPVANPDGYAYSMSRDRLWRKTRSLNASLHKWCVGADANRNWGYRWAETGASRSPCSNIFPGWAPFSEPEVRAVKDYLEPQVARLVAYISLHSYGQLILSPWGFSNMKPSNHEEHRTLALQAIEAIRAEMGTEYTFGTIADMLYPASGTSIDYWQHRGVPYIYGVELRPEEVENEMRGFAIPPDQIEPSGREMLTLLKKTMEYVSERRKRRRAEDGEEKQSMGSSSKDDLENE